MRGQWRLDPALPLAPNASAPPMGTPSLPGVFGIGVGGGWVPSCGRASPAAEFNPIGSEPIDACACALRTHRGRQYLYDRRNPPRRPRSARMRPRMLHPRLAPLRPLETSRQGPRRQAPPLSPLSAPSSGILNLPRLPQALRTCLRATHGRPSQSLALDSTRGSRPEGALPKDTRAPSAQATWPPTF